MATMIPSSPSEEAPDSERRVFAALARLPDPWYVLHSVAWQSVRDGRQGDGEADFVLLHPSYGILIIEVKGGGIRVEGGRWYSIGAGGKVAIKDPFAQATASKHALVRYLRASVEGTGSIPTGHAVAFPDIPSVDPLGPAAPPQIVLSRRELASPGQLVADLVAHWEMKWNASNETVETIAALLAPTTHVRRLLVDEVAEVNARLIALTNQQTGILRAMRRIRRAIIEGGAGTGKTVLALQRTRMLAAEGFRVLLTCFNRPLANHLAAEFRGVPEVHVYSFHALCRWQIGAGGLEFPGHPSPDWWDTKAPDLLIEAVNETGFEVDAVVVDEGQDFRPGWFDSLLMLMSDPDQGPMYVFADSHQALYHDSWSPPFTAEPHLLTTNCRNTRPIARIVSSVFDDEVDDFGTDGPDPELIVTGSPEGTVAAVRRLLHRWVNEGRLRPEQVAVLAQRREMVDRLRSEKLSGLDLKPRGEGGVTCETIHRFKGLEADGVIVVLDEMSTDAHKMLLYVGASRARSLLALVGPPEALTYPTQMLHETG